jgi:hypothetical protein
VRLLAHDDVAFCSCLPLPQFETARADVISTSGLTSETCKVMQLMDVIGVMVDDNDVNQFRGRSHYRGLPKYLYIQ